MSPRSALPVPMTEEEGIVVSVRRERCWVQVAKGSTCGQCQCVCASAGHSFRPALLQLENPAMLNLNPGDHVALGVSGRGLLWAALIVYLFPLLAFLVGGSLGLLFADKFDAIPRDAAAVSGSFLGMTLYFLRLRSSLACRDRTVKPVILRRL